MRARNIARNGKAKPSAAMGEAGEGLEGIFARRFGNARPIIINRDIGPNAILAAWLLRQRHRHAFGVFARIIQQIAKATPHGASAQFHQQRIRSFIRNRNTAP